MRRCAVSDNATTTQTALLDLDQLDAAAKAQAEANALAKREADKAHRKRIADEISTAITMYTDASVSQLVEALMDGKIPHVHVQF